MYLQRNVRRLQTGLQEHIVQRAPLQLGSARQVQRCPTRCSAVSGPHVQERSPRRATTAARSSCSRICRRSGSGGLGGMEDRAKSTSPCFTIGINASLSPYRTVTLIPGACSRRRFKAIGSSRVASEGPQPTQTCPVRATRSPTTSCSALRSSASIASACLTRARPERGGKGAEATPFQQLHPQGTLQAANAL